MDKCRAVCQRSLSFLCEIVRSSSTYPAKDTMCLICTHKIKDGASKLFFFVNKFLFITLPVISFTLPVVKCMHEVIKSCFCIYF